MGELSLEKKEQRDVINAFKNSKNFCIEKGEGDTTMSV